MGGQGGCEWRSEALVKIHKKKNGGGGRVRGSGWGGGGQGGWERRIEAFVKIQQVAQRATIAHMRTSKYF